MMAINLTSLEEAVVWKKLLLELIASVLIPAGQGLLKGLAECLLWWGTCGGSALFLALAILSNLYLLIRPVLVSTLTGRPLNETFTKARKSLMRAWLLHGRLFHDYRVTGFEHIPDRGGAIIVYFHGPIPLDYMLLTSKILLEKGRIVRSVVDRNFIWLPGFEMIGRHCGAHSLGREGCIKLLKRGEILGIAPGGGLESQLSSTNYETMWKNRVGFAAISIAAGNVPIIPVFTTNIREAFVAMEFAKRLWQLIYDLAKIPAVPIYGFFPVRLHTHVGPPIYPGPGAATPEDLRDRVLLAIRNMIVKHQKLPGNVLRAVTERIYYSDSEKIARSPSNRASNQFDKVCIDHKSKRLQRKRRRFRENRKFGNKVTIATFNVNSKECYRYTSSPCSPSTYSGSSDETQQSYDTMSNFSSHSSLNDTT